MRPPLTLTLLIVGCPQPADTASNQAPRVHSATEDLFCKENHDEDPPALCVDFQGLAVFVVAEDPDGDPLSFEWELSSGGPLDSVENVDALRYHSTVQLDPELVEHGELLSCWIGDGELTVAQRWTVITD